MEIHPKFKFNGESFINHKLKEVAYNLVKEGEPFEIAIGDFLLDWLNTSKTLTVFTSGSTGKPKKIELQKTQMVNSALATGSFFNLSSGDSALLCLPCDFIAGKMMLVRAMVLGLELDNVKPNSNPLVNISKKYDFVAMIPLQAQNSLDKLNQVKKLIIGGAPVTGNLSKSLQEVKTLVYETYGMTETITHIAANRLNNNRSKEDNYFKVLPDIFISKDNRNCLIIDAPKISNERIITNDLVELVSEKEFKWLGRYDTIINSGGIKLVPEQIEARLSSIIKNRFFVTGIPDEKLGEKLLLLIEGKVNIPEIFARISGLNTLSKFEKPKSIFCVTKFEESVNGKLLCQKTLKTFLDN